MINKEQIEKIQEIINDCYVVDSYIAAEGSEGGYIDTEEAAKAIVEAGYGDVSEYKAEIRELKADLDHQIDATNDAENLASHLQYDLDEARAQLKTQKQAKIDTINTIVKYCETPSHWNELKDCKLFGGKSDDLRVFLNGIFKENNDEKA